VAAAADAEAARLAEIAQLQRALSERDAELQVPSPSEHP